MKLATDQRGIVVGMVVMIASIFVVAILFITTMPAVGILWDTIYPSGYPSYAEQTMNLLNNVCGWTLLCLIVGCLAYGVALAAKRDPYDVQM